MLCPGCQSKNEEKARFCTGCGSSLSAIREAGSAIGNYSIIKVLRGNPSGWTYLAGEKGRRKKVKLTEVLLPAGSIDTAAAREFIMKMKPFRILDSNFTNSAWFVWEYKEGKNLEDYLREKACPLDDEEAISFMEDVLEFLNFCSSFEEEVVLKDLSAATFLIDETGRLIPDNPGTAFLINDSSVLKRNLNPGYAAPEIFEGKDATPLSDVFSAGALFHYFLTGKDPQQRRKDLFNFDLISKYNNKIGVELEKFIMKMLSPIPSKRPGDLFEMARELKKINGESDPAHQYLTNGIAAFNRRDYRTAISEFSRAALLSPERTAVYLWRGQAHLKAGNYSKAVTNFTRVIGDEPENETALLRRGIAKAELGEYTEAVGDFNSVLALNPKESRAYVGRAIAYKQLGRPDEAEKDYTDAVSLDANETEAYLGRALLRYDRGDFKGALADYNRTISLDPGSAFAYLGRGLLKRMMEEDKEALFDIEQALEIDPGYAAAFLERGIIFLSMRMYETALLDFNRTLDLDPGNVEALFYRGKACYMFGDYGGAVRDMDLVLREETDFAEAYEIRGKSKQRLGMSAEGAGDLALSRKYSP